MACDNICEPCKRSSTLGRPLPESVKADILAMVKAAVARWYELTDFLVKCMLCPEDANTTFPNCADRATISFGGKKVNPEGKGHG